MILSILQNVPQKTITNKPAIQKQNTTQRSISTELRFKFIIHEHQLDNAANTVIQFIGST